MPFLLYSIVMLGIGYTGKGCIRKTNYETVVLKKARTSNGWRGMIAVEVVVGFLIGHFLDMCSSVTDSGTDTYKYLG